MKQISYYILEHFENSNFSILERLHINKDTGNHDHHYNYHPTTKDELKELVDQLIEKRGNKANLNDIYTSEITDMHYLFVNSEFNGNISEWDVNNAKDMYCMFYKSKFNGDISNWNVSNVKDMRNMFDKSPLEKNPPKWYKQYEANKQVHSRTIAYQ